MNRLSFRYSNSRFVKALIPAGSDEPKKLACNRRDVKLTRDEMVLGNEPAKELASSDNSAKSVNNPIAVGKLPLIPRDDKDSNVIVDPTPHVIPVQDDEHKSVATSAPPLPLQLQPANPKAALREGRLVADIKAHSATCDAGGAVVGAGVGEGVMQALKVEESSKKFDNLDNEHRPPG